MQQFHCDFFSTFCSCFFSSWSLSRNINKSGHEMIVLLIENPLCLTLTLLRLLSDQLRGNIISYFMLPILSIPKFLHRWCENLYINLSVSIHFSKIAPPLFPSPTVTLSSIYDPSPLISVPGCNFKTLGEELVISHGTRFLWSFDWNLIKKKGIGQHGFLNAKLLNPFIFWEANKIYAQRSDADFETLD